MARNHFPSDVGGLEEMWEFDNLTLTAAIQSHVDWFQASAGFRPRLSPF